jgi:hypothetical protein
VSLSLIVRAPRRLKVMVRLLAIMRAAGAPEREAGRVLAPTRTRAAALVRTRTRNARVSRTVL